MAAENSTMSMVLPLSCNYTVAKNGTVCTCTSADYGGVASVSRFVLSGVLGSAMCIVGIVANLVVIGTLVQPRLRKHSLLFVALAACDILLLAAYLTMHSLPDLQWGAGNERQGHSRSVLFLGSVAQTAVPYAAVLAVFERTLAYVCPRVGRCVCHKICGIASLVALALFAVGLSAAQLSAFDVCPPDCWDALVLWPIPQWLSQSCLSFRCAKDVYDATYLAVVTLPPGCLLFMAAAIVIASAVAGGEYDFEHSWRPHDDRSDAARLSDDFTNMAFSVVCLYWKCWVVDVLLAAPFDICARILAYEPVLCALQLAHVANSAAKLYVYAAYCRSFCEQLCGGGAVLPVVWHTADSERVAKTHHDATEESEHLHKAGDEHDTAAVGQ